MGEMITKPGTNAIVVAVLNLFLFGAAGYFLMGQTKKAIISVAIMLIAGPLTCFLVSSIYPWIAAYDGYLLGQKLQAGESIGENENGLEFLNAIFK
jgi:uncharacterized membrane protein